MSRFKLNYAPRFELITRNEMDHDVAIVVVVETKLEWQDKKFRFEVPLGFQCDGASVPNALYPMLDANAFDLLIPGIAHDYLYRIDAVVVDSEGERQPTRLEADQVMVNVCKYVGVDWFDRRKIFYALRVGGAPSFRQKRVDWFA